MALSRIDATNQRIDVANQRIYDLRTDLTNRIEDVRSELTSQMQDVRSELTQMMRDAHSDLVHRIDSNNERIDRFFMTAATKESQAGIERRLNYPEREMGEIKHRVAA